MKTQFAVSLSLCWLLFVPADMAWGQGIDQQTGQAPIVSANAAAKIVGFRTTEWKTIHSPSQADAEQTIATLTKLGCEVKSEQHGDHLDIQFQCPQWRSMKLGTDMLVNQWSQWCQTQGLETVIVNPPANSEKPTVQYRLIEPRTVHLHDADKARQIINTLTLIGCDITNRDHNGHIDATFRCPEWKTIELANEDQAHAWQRWLDDSGFETQHEHVHQ